MKQYYFHTGQEEKGPMSFEDLLKSGIQADTQVWYEGLENWTSAKDLEELKQLFAKATPPPFNPATNSRPTNPISNLYEKPLPSRRRSRPVFKVLIFGVLAITAFIIYMNSRGRKYIGTPTYQESKMTVKDYERTHPNEFLSATGTYNKTLFGKNVRVHGTVTNSATVARFKDIVIQISYYSATKTLIEQERFVLYEFVPAKSEKDFEWKIKPPSGTETLGWDAVDGVEY